MNIIRTTINNLKAKYNDIKYKAGFLEGANKVCGLVEKELGDKYIVDAIYKLDDTVFWVIPKDYPSQELIIEEGTVIRIVAEITAKGIHVCYTTTTKSETKLPETRILNNENIFKTKEDAQKHIERILSQTKFSPREILGEQ